MNIYIYISSLCHATSMYFPDPLLPFVPIICGSWLVFYATSCISTELL